MTLILDHITLKSLITITKGINTIKNTTKEKVEVNIKKEKEVEIKKEKEVNIKKVIEKKKRKGVIREKVIIIL